jgi:hypothetical protein
MTTSVRLRDILLFVCFLLVPTAHVPPMTTFLASFNSKKRRISQFYSLRTSAKAHACRSACPTPQCSVILWSCPCAAARAWPPRSRPCQGSRVRAPPRRLPRGGRCPPCARACARHRDLRQWERLFSFDSDVSNSCSRNKERSGLLFFF